MTTLVAILTGATLVEITILGGPSFPGPCDRLSTDFGQAPRDGPCSVACAADKQEIGLSNAPIVVKSNRRGVMPVFPCSEFVGSCGAPGWRGAASSRCA